MTAKGTAGSAQKHRAKLLNAAGCETVENANEFVEPLETCARRCDDPTATFTLLPLLHRAQLLCAGAIVLLLGVRAMQLQYSDSLPCNVVQGSR